ncbi:MAG: hypothetical protein U0X76_04080 [Bacteroidia bacterium]
MVAGETPALLSIMFLGWGRNFMSFTNISGNMTMFPVTINSIAVTTILILRIHNTAMLAGLAVVSIEGKTLRNTKDYCIDCHRCGTCSHDLDEPFTFTNLTNEKGRAPGNAASKGADNPQKKLPMRSLPNLQRVKKSSAKVMRDDPCSSSLLPSLWYLLCKYRYKKGILIYGLLVIIAVI